MDLEISQAAFARHLSRVRDVTTAKSPMPSARMVRLTATDGAVAFAAESTTLGWTSLEPCSVKSPGVCAVDAAELFDRVKALPIGLVRVVADAKSVTLSAVGARRSFKLPALQVNEVAEMREPDGAAEVSIPGADLSAALGAVKHASCLDADRPTQYGCQLASVGGTVQAYATDGHRVARAAVGGATAAFVAHVPPEGTSALLRLAADAEEVTLSVGSRLFVTSPIGTLRIGLVSADFPAVEMMMGLKGAVAEVDSAQLLDAIRAVRLAASADNNRIGLEFGDVLIVSASDPGGNKGESTDAIPYESAKPMSWRGAILASYLADAVASLGSERVSITVGKSPLEPITVRPVGGVDRLCVVCPQRLDPK